MTATNQLSKEAVASTTADREIVVSRLLNAPRELVFKVWTEPEHIKHWYGPNGFSLTIHEMDVRPGGAWRFIMHGPDGVDYPNENIYSEVIRPEKLVYTHTAPRFHTTVIFEERGNKTNVTQRMVFDTAPERNMVVEKYGAIEGANQTFSRMEEHVAKMSAKQELLITRTFNAPLELVWKAWTEPDRLAQWWGGPKGFQVAVHKIDFVPGGTLLYNVSTPDGMVMWGKFVYREIMPPERMIFINSFSDKDGNTTRSPFSATWPLELMNTLTLTEHEGKTTLVIKSGPFNATEEECKTFSLGMEGMQAGFGGTFDRLAEYLSASHS